MDFAERKSINSPSNHIEPSLSSKEGEDMIIIPKKLNWTYLS